MNREREPRLRIAVVGDFHLLEEEWELSERAMDDIRDCGPDLVVALGDFGTYGNIGSREGIKEAHCLFMRTGAPIRPILGNHDLERESGPGLQPKGEVERALKEIFAVGSEEIYGIIELESIRLLFVSTEPQPEDSCYQVQECYVSDRQFAELTALLERRRGVPVIVFSHAPPLGSALRTVPRTHVRSTNAYLDQNHDPSRWQSWLRQYPEIVMWFSAHYHLSHHYEDAHTYRFGTHFFLTGVHGSCTRDAYRQSRMIDIDDRGISVLTLDHGRRGLLSEQTWRLERPPLQWLQDKLLRRVASCPAGAGEALREGLVSLPPLSGMSGSRFIVATGEGFTWEVWPEHEAVMGSLHVNAKVHALAVSGESIWSAWGNWLGVSMGNTPDRFVRKISGGGPDRCAELASPAVALADGASGSVWFADDAELWRADLADLADEQGNGGIRLNRMGRLPGPADRLAADGDLGCYMISEGRLFRWRGLGGTDWESCAIPGSAVDVVSAEGGLTLLLASDGKLGLLRRRTDGDEELLEIPLPAEVCLSAEELANARCISLDSAGRRFIVLCGGRLLYWEIGWKDALRLDAGDNDVAALALAKGNAENACRSAFAFVRSADREDSQCNLELWELLQQGEMNA